MAKTTAAKSRRTTPRRAKSAAWRELSPREAARFAHNHESFMQLATFADAGAKHLGASRRRLSGDFVAYAWGAVMEGADLQIMRITGPTATGLGASRGAMRMGAVVTPRPMRATASEKTKKLYAMLRRFGYRAVVLPATPLQPRRLVFVAPFELPAAVVKRAMAVKPARSAKPRRGARGVLVEHF